MIGHFEPPVFLQTACQFFFFGIYYIFQYLISLFRFIDDAFVVGFGKKCRAKGPFMPGWAWNLAWFVLI